MHVCVRVREGGVTCVPVLLNKISAMYMRVLALICLCACTFLSAFVIIFLLLLLLLLLLLFFLQRDNELAAKDEELERLRTALSSVVTGIIILLII